MSTFLQVASRVEAAVQAYLSVRDFADELEWREGFKGELDSATCELRRILGENERACPALHPILVALSIVMSRDEDLGRINRSHPDRGQHEFYDEKAVFPLNLSDLLEKSGDRWWEAAAARRDNASRNSPPLAPPAVQRKPTKVTLIVPEPTGSEEGQDSLMAVDEAPEVSPSSGEPSALKGAAATRKRKGSSAAARGTAKRHASSRQRADLAEQGSGGSDHDPVKQGPGPKPVFECQRCMEAGDVCRVDPNGPCQRCKTKKLGCSLMPTNPSTGKTYRRALSESEILDFRLKQLEESRPVKIKKGKGKGKRGTKDTSGAGEPEGAAQSPVLENLRMLTLESGGSSAAGTPADSPAALPPALPEPAPPASTSAPKTADAPGPSAGIVIVRPRPQQLLEPAQRQASSSRSDASPVSDDGSNAARIAALERRQGAMENAMQEFDRRLKQLGV